MNLFLKWLDTKFSGPTNSNATDQMSDIDSLETGDVPTTSDADVPGRPNAVGSGNDVLMPNIYADGDAVTEPDLKILAQTSPDADEPAGFNPYDTAVLQKK